MPDILIRDLPDQILGAIDAQAQRLGLSRNEYLRRELTSQFAPRRRVTVEDLKRTAELLADAKDPQIMVGAWKCGEEKGL